MAINFCHHLFQTKITTDKVSVDGHEALQLIAPGSKGFLAETFIRTPVNIICTFACNIDVHKIVVCGKVGAQKSIGFEIFAYHEKRNAIRLGQHQYQFCDSYVCQPIGKLLSNDKTIFSFTNAMHRPRAPFLGLKAMPAHFVSPESAMETQLRSHNLRNLNSVSFLIFRILRTTAGSVPCVGWIEVWGQPAASSHAQIIADVFSLYESIVCPKLTNVIDQKKLSTTDGNLADSLNKDISIPDDFIDPITQDIMTLPVLLPSGLTVDQTTLDRHEKEEAQWGRSASDPFTGVPFSKTNMPQQNIALKVRLDHFLLKNGSQISVSNRTLGSENINVRTATVSALTKAYTIENSAPGSSKDNVQPPPKRLKITPVTTKRNPVATDLDSLLEEALSGLPSYTNCTPTSSSVQNQQPPVPNCSTCKMTVNILLLYKLGCVHYICWECLIKKKTSSTKIQCSICSEHTDSCNVIKAHHQHLRS